MIFGILYLRKIFVFLVVFVFVFWWVVVGFCEVLLCCLVCVFLRLYMVVIGCVSCIFNMIIVELGFMSCVCMFFVCCIMRWYGNLIVVKGFLWFVVVFWIISNCLSFFIWIWILSGSISICCCWLVGFWNRKFCIWWCECSIVFYKVEVIVVL